MYDHDFGVYSYVFLVKEFNKNILEHARPFLYGQNEKKIKRAAPKHIFSRNISWRKMYQPNCVCFQCFIVRKGFTWHKALPAMILAMLPEIKPRTDRPFRPFFKMAARKILFRQ